MEIHTHTSKALKLSRISGAGFAKEFEASLQCSEEQRLTRYDLNQGREYNNREAMSTKQRRASQENAVQPAPHRGYVSLARVTQT